MASVAGKVIAITGGGSGIGLALAQICASRGATVALGDINQAGLDAAIDSLQDKDKHMATVLDVKSYEVVENWIKSITGKYGKLDGAANLAGVVKGTVPLHETPLDLWDFVMDVNAKGVYHCLRAELQHMNDGASM